MANGPFRFKVSASLDGQEALLRRLYERANPEAQRDMLEWAADKVASEARRLVPRETGELQREITVFRDGDRPTGVGVPASSPAIHKARATEFGTWNYDVGAPAGPKTEWRAKSKPTAAMPWLRTALLVRRQSILRYMKKVLVSGRREKFRTLRGEES
ncbi:MAG: HK97 gp10 family phage protein [Halobacteriales archaeon]|nr:HK97 gp10 family phage protein [Halobacteriales archaeon]